MKKKEKAIEPKKKTPSFNFQPRIEISPLSEFALNEKNPRIAKRKDIERLAVNLETNPNMLMIRPIVYQVVAGKKIIKAGNQRYKAAQSLGWEKAPFINASKLSKKEMDNFILWDNENVGAWDFVELETWSDTFGILIPDKKNPERWNDSNAEMPIIPKYDEKYRAVVIIVETEMDFANLCTKLDLVRSKDYKTSMKKQAQAISFNEFIKKVQWKK